MIVEFIGVTTYSVDLDENDMKKIKKWITENKEETEYMSSKETILKAVKELHESCELEPYKEEKYSESDFYTEKINWSEFEERDADEILNELLRG